MDPRWLPGEVRAREEREREQTCPECGRKKLRHWPYCSEAPINVQVMFAQGEDIRKLRTAKRVGED